jgi:DNA polymerase I-like protein with 3'-5' exonuclease and polymerase domains
MYWDRDADKPIPKRDFDEAVAEWGPPPKIKRAHTFKALNRLLQGGAAYVLKAAMRDVWKSGVCDVMGVPSLTVHDELTGSRPDTPEGVEAREELRHLMENSVVHNVPILVDVEEGPNWGNLQLVN